MILRNRFRDYGSECRNKKSRILKTKGINS